MSSSSITFQEQTRRFQAELLRSTLEEVDWDVGEAARRLGLSRSHVYSLMRENALALSRWRPV